MVSVNEAIGISQEVLVEYDGPGDTRIQRLAQFIMDNIASALECGYESPNVNHNYNPPRVDFPEGIGVPVEDARTIAAAILKECDIAYEERQSI